MKKILFLLMCTCTLVGMPLSASADELLLSLPKLNAPATPAPAAAVPPATPTPAPTASNPSEMEQHGTDLPGAAVQDMLLQAMGFIGLSYRYGGTTPQTGFDCSGFVRYVFKNSLQIALPRTAAQQAQVGQRIDRSQLKPGDLVFFNTMGRAFSHVGIYVGANRFIHSPRTGSRIQIANMTDRYWSPRFNAARRMNQNGTVIAGDQNVLPESGTGFYRRPGLLHRRPLGRYKPVRRARRR